MIKKILLVLMFLIVTCGFLFLAVWRGIFLPNSLNEKEVIFDIEKGQGLEEIALNLERENLIKDDLYFKIYALFRGTAKDIKAGVYKLNPSLTVPQILEKIVKGQTFQIEITIPEGFNLKQIEEVLSEKLERTMSLKFSVKEFKDSFDFLSEIPEEESLEGFLFPDTYLLNPMVNDKEIAEIFLKNFDKKFTRDFKEKIETQQKNIFEIITMASLLEKEVKTEEEKEIVSGILWKRIKINMPLQVDAAIAYIKNTKTGKVSYEEIKIDSPYNTYKYAGLPKGPICNPGLESIRAALNPKESDYWYYLSTPDGQTIFSRTLEEHNIAKAKYLI
ncbi:MAG: endolytic transglycosylase MltG [Candidatus Nealsonbacteria bacterium]|nr:endolytic transglycosylase MltG [Candidatus Nealsonbacteria bacterium]